MPSEILADIVDLLADDKSALASLALVNSDCRYLARSCQFAEIHFDYSNQSHQLLVHLAKEALRKTDLTTRTFPIGVCVRRVTFASRPECVTACYEELHNSIFSERANLYSQEQRDKLRQEAKAHYIALRKLSTLVITYAMPNLEVFTWEDPFSVDDNFLKEVSRCSAQHVRLKRFKLDKLWLMEPPLVPALWPLRSLDLDVELACGWDADQPESEVIRERTLTEALENPISGFFETLFQRCAATLESLSWQHMGIWSKGSISQHKHVHKLFVHERDTTHLDRLVVPILAEGGFNNLRCLSLAWGGEGVSDLTTSHEFHIPEAAIMTLGTIASLERLSLRAGNNFGWRHQWLIDHDKLRQHLRPLSRLKMLALVRDTYPISSFSHMDVEQYYSLRLVGESERADARARVDLDIEATSSVVDTHDMMENQQDEDEESEAEVQIWERAHRNRMLAQAEAYAAVFPALDWVLCGQRPMGFHCELENHTSHKKAIPLTQHRDECYTFLNRTFGICQ
ncbi:hypothetical protein MKX08_002096 [Trichoderma sp. CBMAI-0020]|nr:hypothetical protein MKX08_002096 [Trichoderma sp. CBMAI-0020]